MFVLTWWLGKSKCNKAKKPTGTNEDLCFPLIYTTWFIIFAVLDHSSFVGLFVDGLGFFPSSLEHERLAAAEGGMLGD